MGVEKKQVPERTTNERDSTFLNKKEAKKISLL